MNKEFNNLGHNDFHHNSLNSNKEYIPKYTNNNKYNYNDDSKSINYSQEYNVLISTKNRSFFDKFGLGCSIFNIYYLFNLWYIYSSYGLENLEYIGNNWKQLCARGDKRSVSSAAFLRTGKLSGRCQRQSPAHPALGG